MVVHDDVFKREGCSECGGIIMGLFPFKRIKQLLNDHVKVKLNSGKSPTVPQKQAEGSPSHLLHHSQ